MISGQQSELSSVTSKAQMFAQMGSQITQGVGTITASTFDTKKAEQERIRNVLSSVQSQAGQMAQSDASKMDQVLQYSEKLAALRQADDAISSSRSN